jgi:hypothetical protein
VEIIAKSYFTSGQVLKSKYYPQANILDAKLGKRPIAWRSLMSAGDFLKMGSYGEWEMDRIYGFRGTNDL